MRLCAPFSVCFIVFNTYVFLLYIPHVSKQYYRADRDSPFLINSSNHHPAGIKIGITAELTSGMTFMELYARSILAFQKYARKMTGDATLELPLVSWRMTFVSRVGGLFGKNGFKASLKRLVSEMWMGQGVAS